MLSPTTNLILAEVHAYVSSETGQERIRKALLRRRLPGALDTDIEEAVLGEAHRFLAKGQHIGSIPGWCNARIAARSVDLARGAIRAELALGVRVTDVDLEDRADAVVEPSPNGGLAEARVAVLYADADNDDISAGLTFITRVADEAELLDECPQPAAGATASDAAMWAGLWYAKQSDCFGDGNTVTKRRSRAAKRVRALIEEALEGRGTA
jgi:hypothetical protein